jgi:hypothetical protein
MGFKGFRVFIQISYGDSSRSGFKKKYKIAASYVKFVKIPKWCTAKLGLLPGRHDAWP